MKSKYLVFYNKAPDHGGLAAVPLPRGNTASTAKSRLLNSRHSPASRQPVSDFSCPIQAALLAHVVFSTVLKQKICS
jgi:hypothetical protein